MNFLFVILFILKPYHEIVGNLEKIKDDDKKWILFFNLHNEIIIPKKAFSEDQLTKFKGEHVGLFRYDEDNYAIRKASKRNINPKIKKIKNNVFRGGDQYDVFKGDFGTTIVPKNKKGGAPND